MGKKGVIADAVIVGGTAAGVAVADLVFGTNVWDSIKEFYQAHPVGASFATAAGLDVLGLIASQKFRQTNKYVLGGIKRLGSSLKNDYTQFNAKSLELVRNNAGTVLIVGGLTVVGFAAAIGIMASKGLDYKLTGVDKQEIASYVTAVPGLAGIQGEKGDNGSQGLVGLQGSQGIQGVPGPQGESGKSPTKQDITQAVAEYFKANPLTPPPAPAPYAPPQVFSVSYDAFKKLVTEGVKGVSEATGLSVETLTQLVDGNNSPIVRNGINTYNPELSVIMVDTAAGKATFEFQSGGTKYASINAAPFVGYLVEKTPLEERVNVFQPVNK